MRPRPPPVVALALFFGLGCAATLSGALSPRALLLSATLLLPIALFLRPGLRGRIDGRLLLALTLAVVAGSLRAGAWRTAADSDCRLHLPDDWSGEVTGRFLAASGGGAVPFRVEEGLGSAPGPGCVGVVRGYPDREADVRPGLRVRGEATWRSLPRRAWTTAERAGYLSLESLRVVDDSHPAAQEEEPVGPAAAASAPGLGGWVVKTRGATQERLRRLFGEVAPVTEALILARKEGLNPELRDRFARAGVAHLLAISGFHVGIVAGMLLLLGRLSGAGPRGSPLLAAAGAWGYVLAIGSPDAAVRAAILLALLALGPVRTRPVAPLGALASAFLAFLLVDPGALGRVGFQLSFAGTAALILWSRSTAGEVEAVAGRVARSARAGWARIREGVAAAEVVEMTEAARTAVRGGRARSGGVRGPAGPARGLWTGIGAGVAATVGTLPLVAWHFGQVPLLGIPATLALGPLVALAIPGIFACLALDLVAPGVAGFLAGGVGLLLEIVVRGAGVVAAIQGDAGWVSRWHVVAAGVGGAAGWALGRTGSLRARRIVVGVGAAAGLLLAPVVGAPGTAGTVEIVAIDVGQGDALAVRSPAGRWILVDTGPRSPTFDAGARRILPYLRRAGVDRIEALILTHPDLDHIGGAPAVLRGMEVGGVLDPGRAAAKGPFEDVLVAAEDEKVPWWPAATRSVLELDGLELRVLHPASREAPAPKIGAGETRGAASGTGGEASSGTASPDVGPPVEDANDASVVLLLTYGRFRALLTGDAPAAVEEGVVDRIDGPVQLLKVGHHGSLTSTSRRFLEALRPEAAVISVGFRNRYGHPHPEVVERLEGSGARIYRTDLDGTVIFRARDDGSWTALRPDAPEETAPSRRGSRPPGSFRSRSVAGATH